MSDDRANMVQRDIDRMLAAAYQRGVNASITSRTQAEVDAYQRGHDKGEEDERERIRAAMGVPLWHSTVPVAYFRADDVAAILDAGAER